MPKTSDDNPIVDEYYRDELPMLESRQGLSRRRSLQKEEWLTDISDSDLENLLCVAPAPQERGNLKIMGEPLEDILLHRTDSSLKGAKKKVTIMTPSEELLAAGYVETRQHMQILIPQYYILRTKYISEGRKTYPTLRRLLETF